MRSVLWWLIAGSKGGLNRARIIHELHERPYNANQLSEELGLDYKTVRHHLKLLMDNQIIESNPGERYGAMYFLSKSMEDNYGLFMEIWNKIGAGHKDKERKGGKENGP